MANTTLTLDIIGMTCAACSNRIEKKLNRMNHVQAKVNLTTEKATIDYESDDYHLEDFVEQIQSLGYDVAVEQVELNINGMTCAACSNRIEKVLNQTQGVQQATVNLTTEQALIKYYPSATNTEALIKRIQNIGYDAETKTSSKAQSNRKKQELKHKRNKLIISAILSLPLLLVMVVEMVVYLARTILSYKI